MKMNYVDKFKDKTLLVLGDIMVDKYVYGQTTRISPEAPVPVVKITNEECVPGGAGNVANNIRSLGARVYVSGVVGHDKDAEIISRILKNRDIDISLIFQDDSRPTTVKHRVISGNNYQLIRLDYEKTTAISKELESKMFHGIRKIITKVDAIILSDYNKGVITNQLTTKVIQLANTLRKPIIVDGKPEHLLYFKNCTLIAPNLKEAIEMSGISQDILGMGQKLVRVLGSAVFLTRGPEGISVFDKHGNHTHVPPIKTTKIFDVTGAGDTVVAVTALALASGLDLVDSAKTANFAAGLVVQKPGTSILTVDELKSAFRQEISHYLQEGIEVKQKIIAEQLDMIEKAANLFINAYKKGNKIIAFGNGGSASDAQHLVGELVGRFKVERKALPAIALTTDSSVVTAIANDYGFEYVFERQIEANAAKGDIVVAISTSGNSPNIIYAVEKAKKMGCKTIGLTGKEGGKLAKIADVSIVVPSNNTPRIQEAHISIIHIVCELLDKELAR